MRFSIRCLLLLILCLSVSFHSSIANAEDLNAGDWAKIKFTFLQSIKDASLRDSAMKDMKRADNGDAVYLLLSQFPPVFDAMLLKKVVEQQKDREFLGSFVTVLGSYRSPEAIKQLIKKGLRSKDPRVQLLAIQSFEINANKEGLQPLQDFLTAKRKLPKSLAVHIIRALQAINDTSTVNILHDFGMKEDRWEVQLELIESFRKLGGMHHVPVLLHFMLGSTKRIQEEALKCLVDLTGQNFHTNGIMWKKWYEDNLQAIEAGTLERGNKGYSKSSGSGVEFFGVELNSDRLIFILDASKSMDEVDENDPDGRSKLQIAKSELIGAVQSLPDGALFNIVFFHRDVITWKPEMTKKDKKTTAAAVTWIESVDTVFGTDVYAALKKGLELANVLLRGGRASYKKGVVISGETEPGIADTMVFLSDGMPFGKFCETTDTDLILEWVSDWNKEVRIAIHTIHLTKHGGGKGGGGKGGNFMAELASRNWGTYTKK